MNSNKIKTKYLFVMFSLFSLIMITACQPEDSFKNNGLTSGEELDASFTVTPVDGAVNTYMLQGQPNSYNNYWWGWDVGYDSNTVKGGTEQQFYFPDAGTYTLIHAVATSVGGESFTSTKQLVVEQSDPNGGNLVEGGRFASSEDIAKWTIGGTGSTDGVWTFADGKATLTASGWAGRGIYQAIDVVEGQSYKIDMQASSTSGVSETWFEVYCGYSVPTTVDYSEGGKLYSISTWDNPNANNPFSGKISSLMLGKPEDNTGVFTATATGTVYLVIRGGGNDMRDGIAITNVEMRGTN